MWKNIPNSRFGVFLWQLWTILNLNLTFSGRMLSGKPILKGFMASCINTCVEEENCTNAGWLIGCGFVAGVFVIRCRFVTELLARKLFCMRAQYVVYNNENGTLSVYFDKTEVWRDFFWI